MSKATNIIIIGKPGAGKSSVSQRLSESLDLSNVDFGKYLRGVAASDSLLGRYVTTFWSRNNLKEIGFEYFDKEFAKCVSNNKSFILSSPKLLTDAQEIDEQLAAHKLQVDAIIELDLASEVCMERVARKNEGQAATSDDESSSPAEMRIANFENHIEELRTYYQAQPHVTYLTIDAAQPLDDVLANISARLAEVAHKPADYSKIITAKPAAEEEDAEEASDELFVRINGTRRAELVQLMLDLANNPKPKIPLTHPVPLFGGNLDELKNRQYAITRKLNGLRRLLVVDQGVVYAISQQYNVFKCVGLPLPGTLSMDWNKSLFDAEIVTMETDTAGGRSLFILDCLCAADENVRSEKLAVRLTHAKKFTEEFKDSEPAISMFCQTYYTMGQLPLLTKLGRNGDPSNPVPSARCMADGLMFIPTTLRYNIGCSRFLLAWKPVPNTIDLAVFKEDNEEGKPGLALKSYNHKDGSYQTCGHLEPVPEGLASLADETVVECIWKEGKWLVQKVRKDRVHPNADWVVQEAIEHAKQPVSPKMLLEKVQAILVAGRKPNPPSSSQHRGGKGRQNHGRY